MFVQFNPDTEPLAEFAIGYHIPVMTKEAVNDVVNLQPFKPFALRLTDGSRVTVPHRDFILISQGGRTAIVNTEGEKLSIVDLALGAANESNSPNGG